MSALTSRQRPADAPSKHFARQRRCHAFTVDRTYPGGLAWVCPVYPDGRQSDLASGRCPQHGQTLPYGEPETTPPEVAVSVIRRCNCPDCSTARMTSSGMPAITIRCPGCVNQQANVRALCLAHRQNSSCAHSLPGQRVRRLASGLAAPSRWRPTSSRSTVPGNAGGPTVASRSLCDRATGFNPVRSADPRHRGCADTEALLHLYGLTAYTANPLCCPRHQRTSVPVPCPYRASDQEDQTSAKAPSGRTSRAPGRPDAGLVSLVDAGVAVVMAPPDAAVGSPSLPSDSGRSTMRRLSAATRRRSPARS